MMPRNLIYLFIACFILLNGCATAPSVSRPKVTPSAKARLEGVYHKVRKGETLWRISKAYKVELEAIVAANQLRDASKIKIGQRLFIPGASKEKEVSRAGSSLTTKLDFIWPVKGKVIGFFGVRKNGAINKGIDIQAKSGSRVVAARGGKVTFIDKNLKGYGKTVIVDHQDGYTTVYTNNSEILVKIGQTLDQNMAIAKVGSTGRATTACLHFEIRKKYKPQNPFYYLP